ncbi:MAG: hypothetical protein JNK82_20605, partial [Myxococcaceae bacterium]|nr:hypothetical protein [Myxococcaceae bacterium]
MKKRVAAVAVVVAALGACIDFRSSLEEFCTRNPARCAMVTDGGTSGGGATAGGSTAGGSMAAGGTGSTAGGGSAGGGTATAGGMSGGMAGGATAGGGAQVCTAAEVCHVESFKV